MNETLGMVDGTEIVRVLVLVTFLSQETVHFFVFVALNEVHETVSIILKLETKQLRNVGNAKHRTESVSYGKVISETEKRHVLQVKEGYSVNRKAVNEDAIVLLIDKVAFDNSIWDMVLTYSVQNSEIYRTSIKEDSLLIF